MSTLDVFTLSSRIFNNGSPEESACGAAGLPIGRCATAWSASLDLTTSKGEKKWKEPRTEARIRVLWENGRCKRGERREREARPADRYRTDWQLCNCATRNEYAAFESRITPSYFLKPISSLMDDWKKKEKTITIPIDAVLDRRDFWQGKSQTRRHILTSQRFFFVFNNDCQFAIATTQKRELVVSSIPVTVEVYRVTRIMSRLFRIKGY